MMMVFVTCLLSSNCAFRMFMLACSRPRLPCVAGLIAIVNRCLAEHAACRALSPKRGAPAMLHTVHICAACATPAELKAVNVWSSHVGKIAANWCRQFTIVCFTG